MRKRLSELLDHDDVLDLLRSEIAKVGSQSEWAKEHRVDRPIVNRILSGQRNIQPKVTDALGLEEVEFFRKREC